MITSPGANVQFTPEQALQLAEWGKRLKAVQEEISISEKNLTDLTSQIANRTRDKQELDAQLSSLRTETARLEALKDTLNEETRISTLDLADHQKQMKEKTRELDARKKEIDELGSELVKDHTHLSKKEENHQKESQELAKRQLLVEQAEQAFLEAMETIKWK